MINILPLIERSPKRSSSSPPAEAGFVGTVFGITSAISLPPSKSNKSVAYGAKTFGWFKFLLLSFRQIIPQANPQRNV